MSDVRSAAAQAGVCDIQQLIYDVSGAFNGAKTTDELDDLWKNYVSPVYCQIDEKDMKLIGMIYALKASTLIKNRV